MLKTLQESITTLINNILPADLQNKVALIFVENETQRRVDLVVKAVKKHTELLGVVKSLDKPDHKFTDTNNNLVELFSEKRKQEISKAKSNVEKLEKAVKDAFDNNKWDELVNRLGDKDN